MKVRDPTTSGAFPTPAKVGPGGRGSSRGSRSGSGFAPVLATAAAAAAIPLEPAPARANREASPRRIGDVGAIERVLIGSRGGEPEARVSVADGSPGGAEIRLVATAGGRAVVAEILTASAGSRETLSNAMEEIRVRLRRRGIALSVMHAPPRRDDRGRR